MGRLAHAFGASPTIINVFKPFAANTGRMPVIQQPAMPITLPPSPAAASSPDRSPPPPFQPFRAYQTPPKRQILHRLVLLSDIHLDADPKFFKMNANPGTASPRPAAKF